jgi:hypothetical protein
VHPVAVLLLPKVIASDVDRAFPFHILNHMGKPKTSDQQQHVHMIGLQVTHNYPTFFLAV